MKKSLFGLMFVVPFAAFGANANYEDVQNMYGEININYNRPKKNIQNSDKKDMYFGVHADLSFLNWQNKYKSNAGVDLGSDKYKFRSMLGADISFGYKFANKWRVDAELGYMGEYSDIETEYHQGYVPEKTEFNLAISYLMANAYYDVYGGLYMGAGFGGALVSKSIDNSVTTKTSSNSISPIGAFMIGYNHPLDDRVDFDIRYKLAALDGGSVGFYGGNADIGWIIDNAISLGIKYNF